uniref:DUF4371 domain-containing protein n=1 Tax=Anopheles christyi TaxID=43041 RepID=A0A182JTC3_9DIPT
RHDEHEQSDRKGNYLSTTTWHNICDEFLEIISDSIKNRIVEDVKAAKYYSIKVDTTPDIARIDLLTFIIRYVASYEQEVLDNLDNLGLNISNWRGQSLDNASNMSGKYSGLQARIKQHSANALFIPCANHSPNLVANFVAEN